MFNFPDLSGVFMTALFGLGCAVLLALGAVGALLWFIIVHVRII